MTKIDNDELEILSAYEKGQMKSIAARAELAKFKAAARATAIKETLFLHSMPDVYASIKEGMSEPLDMSARKLDW